MANTPPPTQPAPTAAPPRRVALCGCASLRAQSVGWVAKTHRPSPLSTLLIGRRASSDASGSDSSRRGLHHFICRLRHHLPSNPRTTLIHHRHFPPRRRARTSTLYLRAAAWKAAHVIGYPQTWRTIRRASTRAKLRAPATFSARPSAATCLHPSAFSTSPRTQVAVREAVQATHGAATREYLVCRRHHPIRLRGEEKGHLSTARAFRDRSDAHARAAATACSSLPGRPSRSAVALIAPETTAATPCHGCASNRRSMLAPPSLGPPARVLMSRAFLMKAASSKAALAATQAGITPAASADLPRIAPAQAHRRQCCLHQISYRRHCRPRHRPRRPRRCRPRRRAQRRRCRHRAATA